jgi:hypothetical protein
MSRPCYPSLAALATLVATLGAAAPGPAQEAGNPSGRRAAVMEGTHVFRRILFDFPFQPLAGFDELRANPGQTILIVLGRADRLREVPGRLEAYVRRGGAVLLATDRQLTGSVREAVRATAGVSVSKESLVCTFPDLCYQRLGYCPVVIPTLEGQETLFRHPSQGVTKPPFRVATNVPSMLLKANTFPPWMHELAQLPVGSKLETKDGTLVDLEYPPLFAVGGELGLGRILVLADHSIFINQMMLPTDNNNVEFSYNCLAWLAGAGKRRNKVLLVEEGRIQTKFEVPLRPLAVTPEDALRVLWDRRNELLVEGENALAGMEEEDSFNRMLLDGLDSAGLPPHRLARLAALLLAVALLVYGIYRLGIRGRYRVDTSVPLLAGAMGRNLPASPLVEERHHEMLRSGNLFEAAHLAARDWFARTGLPPPPAGTKPVPLPPVALRGGWWRRRALRAGLDRLWHLARGVPVRVSPGALQGLLRQMKRLEEALALGEVKLGGTANQGEGREA